MKTVCKLMFLLVPVVLMIGCGKGEPGSSNPHEPEAQENYDNPEYVPSYDSPGAED